METSTTIESSSLSQINDDSNSLSSSISFSGGSDNSSAEAKSNQSTSLGNVIIGNGQWIIGEDNTPEQFSSLITDFVTRKLDSVISKLRMRLPLSNAGNPSENGNPFADSRNPFGAGNMPDLPALDSSKSVSGENFPNGVVNPIATGDNQAGDSEHSFADVDLAIVTGDNQAGDSEHSFADVDLAIANGENPIADSSNPFPGGDNPFSGADNTPEQSSFDISKIALGNNNGTDVSGTDVSGEGSTPQIPEVLKSVQDNILSITSSVEDLFANGNTTPLQNPSELLRLFRADMYSFNQGVNTVTKLDSDDSSANVTNLFVSLFAGSDSSASGSNPFGNLLDGNQGQIPFDIITVALEGILPFTGSDNVFTTPDGEIPIGYGNHDFGNGNVAIGNANWNYGNFNASIGNGNWHWDFNKDNATIGNGNWHLDFSENNRTVGNGNWYWESTSDNKTLGNGNWHFGNNNTTIGNGNWDFGSNNTIIGNGNWVFTSNSIVIGNGNWSVIIDKSSNVASDFHGLLDNLELSIGTKDAADNLVNSLLGKFGDAFQPLTGDFDESTLKTYNQLLYSDSNSTTAALPSA
ncbi:hypothetical protein BZZ01_32375 [Nostocales cyanobacterium HT-58-2]|nr:hypothetical protein BZZ01_32375 [Nostocales cyanobacterium HT-58-2]